MTREEGYYWVEMFGDKYIAEYVVRDYGFFYILKNGYIYQGGPDTHIIAGPLKAPDET